MVCTFAASRAPHGARGLKLPLGSRGTLDIGSRPARGAWIEIPKMKISLLGLLVAPRTGRVD